MTATFQGKQNNTTEGAWDSLVQAKTAAGASLSLHLMGNFFSVLI